MGGGSGGGDGGGGGGGAPPPDDCANANGFSASAPALNGEQAALPPFLIPRPDGGSDAARTNKRDPDYPYDPTPPGPNPDPCADGGDSPDKMDVHPPATSNEVMDHIRAECKNAKGINFPSVNHKDGFSGFFQASVRKSINAAQSDGRRPYQEDVGGSSNPKKSAHPQLGRRTDGYAEGSHTLQLSPNFKAVTSILEVKFSDNIGNALKRSQSENHIKDLARYYDLVPSDGRIEAPRYVIVSNSSIEENGDQRGVEDLGYNEQHLKKYAEERGVNLAHLRVTRDAGDNFYLEGDIIGTAVSLGTWLNDRLRDFKISFEVECQPEKDN